MFVPLVEDVVRVLVEIDAVLLRGVRFVGRQGPAVSVLWPVTADRPARVDGDRPGFDLPADVGTDDPPPEGDSERMSRHRHDEQEAGQVGQQSRRDQQAGAEEDHRPVDQLVGRRLPPWRRRWIRWIVARPWCRTRRTPSSAVTTTSPTVWSAPM